MTGNDDFIGKDYYGILDIPVTANDAEIKAAFRKKAMKWHPDKHRGESESKQKEAEQRMKDLNEANAVLTDKLKKIHYDALRRVAGAAQPSGSPSKQTPGYSGPVEPQQTWEESERQRAYGEQDARDRRAGERAGRSNNNPGTPPKSKEAYRKEVEDAFRRAHAKGAMPSNDDFERMWRVHNDVGSSGSGSGEAYQRRSQNVTIKKENLPRRIRIENGSIDVILETCDGSDLTIDGNLDSYEPQGDSLNLRNLNGRITVPRSAYGLLELIIETGDGTVKGSVATAASIKTFSGNVELQVEALLNYTLTQSGRVVVETPVGPRDFRPPAGRDVGNLKVETHLGYAKVTANARQGAAR